MSLDGVMLLETEAPNDKTDLVRLEDRYGRQVSGYESAAHMSSQRLEEFQHFRFHPGAKSWEVEGDPLTVAGRFSISFEGFADASAFARRFTADHGALYNVCQGELRDAAGGWVARVGEAERGSFLAQVPGLGAVGAVLLLKIRLFS
jgi:hypothetical protein